MKSRLALGVALLCAGGFIAGISGSFAQEAKIGSASIKLTPPKGQCWQGDEKGDEALVSKLRELVGAGNQVLALYSDCDELVQIRSGKREEFNEYSTYLTATANLNAVARLDDLAKFCAMIRAKSDQDVLAILQKACC